MAEMYAIRASVYEVVYPTSNSDPEITDHVLSSGWIADNTVLVSGSFVVKILQKVEIESGIVLFFSLSRAMDIVRQLHDLTIKESGKKHGVVFEPVRHFIPDSVVKRYQKKGFLFKNERDS